MNSAAKAPEDTAFRQVVGQAQQSRRKSREEEGGGEAPQGKKNTVSEFGWCPEDSFANQWRISSKFSNNLHGQLCMLQTFNPKEGDTVEEWG